MLNYSRPGGKSEYTAKYRPTTTSADIHKSFSAEANDMYFAESINYRNSSSRVSLCVSVCGHPECLLQPMKPSDI